MAAIEAIVFATAAGFAVIAAATIVVIIGVHQEERSGTLAHGRPPTVPALLARRVIGAYVHLLPELRPRPDDPEEEPSGERQTRPAPAERPARHAPQPVLLQHRHMTRRERPDNRIVARKM